MPVPIKTTINEDAAAVSGSLEARFVTAFQQYAGSQSSSVREMVLAGYILRELGVCQQLVDLERQGEFAGMSLVQKRVAIAEFIALGLSDKLPGTAPIGQEKKKNLGSWGQIGS